MTTTTPTYGATRPTWRSWSGLSAADPRRVLDPTSPSEVVDAVRAAGAEGLRVKMVGSGHSFCDIAVTDGLLLRPDRLSGITALNRDEMTVTALAGTPLHELNRQLHGLGLALHNMGDIDRQTVAGATSTGTHGTGGRRASLSDQIARFDIVTGDGSLVTARPDGTATEARLFEAGRVGLGALGVLTSLTFHVEPAFALEAVEKPMTWAEVVDGFDDLAAANEHFEAYWFPHTDRLLTKSNNRIAAGEVHPLSRIREYVEDELIANTAFGALNRLGNRSPRTIAAINRLSARAMSARTFSDASHRVFTSQRRVVFREMEYALPREVGMQALTDARALIERQGWRISFPVEIRHTPGDDIWLSTSHGHESVYLAFHVNGRTDHTTYFAGIEQILKAYGGRPHWGKLHTLGADDLAAVYPRFEDFVALRDELDPQRLFGNAYLQKVLGS